MSDATLADFPTEDEAAVSLAEPVGIAELDTRPRCEKCGVPNDAAACPACGWYPAAGVFVEIDRSYEALHNPELAEEVESTGSTGDLQKHIDVWKTLIPTWGWVAIGAGGAVLASSVAARVYFETVSASWRTSYSVTQLFLGVFVALVIHFAAFVLSSSDDAEMGPKDIVVKPFKAWLKIVGDLPYRAWLVQIASAALAAVIGSTLIIGGIPYEKLLDWGFKQRAAPNLVGAIADQAKKAQAEDKSMEDSMNDFASGAAGDMLGDEEKEAQKPRTSLDCLLIGYRLTTDKRIESVLLASEVDGQLKYIGQVRPKLDEEQRAELVEKFERSQAQRPFVKTNASGFWLKPKFTCKASYTEWPEGKSQPLELQWEELLEEMSLPW